MPTRPLPLIWLLSHAELEANGKPVECLWCGPEGITFHVPHIGELIVTPEMLATVVANFQARDQNPPRVPINVNHAGDSGNIQEAKAVGWIVDLSVSQTDERVSLLFTPHWSEEAKQVIEAGGFRYVSVGMQLAATDAVTGEKIGPRLMEVSLTGSPAIPDLHPIELSLDLQSKIASTAARLANGMSDDGEKDMLDQAMAIASAFFAAFPDSDGSMWNIEAVFYENRQMIVEERVRQVSEEGESMAEHMWRLGFELAEDGAISFAPREEWEAVEQRFVSVEAPPEEVAAAIPLKQIKIPSDVAVASDAGGVKEIEMDLKQIVEMLGLTDGADEAAVQAEIARLRGVEQKLKDAEKVAEEAKAEASKKLSEKDTKIVALSERMTASSEETVTLSTRIKVLEDEKNVAEAKAAIDAGLKSGKLMASEVASEDDPMRKIALSDRTMFQAILDKRPASNLTREMSLAGEPETEVNSDEFWALVGAERDKAGDKAGTTSVDAQQIVLKARPEFNVLFQAAAQYAASQRNKGA